MANTGEVSATMQQSQAIMLEMANMQYENQMFTSTVNGKTAIDKMAGDAINNISRNIAAAAG